jgi:hypothetical protein
MIGAGIGHDKNRVGRLARERRFADAVNAVHEAENRPDFPTDAKPGKPGLGFRIVSHVRSFLSYLLNSLFERPPVVIPHNLRPAPHLAPEFARFQ